MDKPRVFGLLCFLFSKDNLATFNQKFRLLTQSLMCNCPVSCDFLTYFPYTCKTKQLSSGGQHSYDFVILQVFAA